MSRTLRLMNFLFSELPIIQKIRILLGYLLLSRVGTTLKILGMRLTYEVNLKNYYLMLLKEVFLDDIYTFTTATHQKLSDLEKDANKSARGGGGALIVDVGANIGITTAFLKNRYPKTYLIAIEASPINYNFLNKNVDLNKFTNIETLNCFVSNNEKHIKFFHNKNRPGGSYGTGFKEASTKELIKFDVKTKKLSKIIAGFKNIVIKIDVEGAEYLILDDLKSSKSIDEILEIVVEISIYNISCFNALNKVIRDYIRLGFSPRFVSDYQPLDRKKRSLQGHLLLILFR
jgi:FkbM family methyltransferase